MNVNAVFVMSTIILLGSGAPHSQATTAPIEAMPAALETRFALSALPPAMREHATVYLLDPVS